MANKDTTDGLWPWQLESAGLHMQADPTEAGKLVRLADVVSRLIEVKELPRKIAIEALCKALEAANPPPALFLAQAGHYARPADDALFGFHTEETWAVQEIASETLERMHRDPWRFNLPDGEVPWALSAEAMDDIRSRVSKGERPTVLRRSERDRLLCAPGVPSAVRYIRERWPEVRRVGEYPDPMADPRGPTHGLAVRLSAVLALWSWGSDAATDVPASLFPLVDWPALVAYRRANPGTSWADGNQLEVARAEHRVRGGSDSAPNPAALAAMAGELEVSRQALKDALFRSRKRPKPTKPEASPLPDADARHRRTG